MPTYDLQRGETVKLERAFATIIAQDANAEYYFEGLTGDVWEWFSPINFPQLDTEAEIEYSNYYHSTKVHVVGFYVKSWSNEEFEGRISVLFKG